MENYLKSLSIQLLDLEAQSPLMSNEKFRSEAISFLKGLLKIVNALIPAEKQSNFEGLKNLGIDKFVSTHEELLEWGFEVKVLLKIPPIDYYEKQFGYSYFPKENQLFEFGCILPFRTKQDFIRCIKPTKCPYCS